MLARRALLHRTSLARLASTTTPSSSTTAGERPPPPRPSWFSWQTLTPFLVLSCITSLALNLSHSRSTTESQTRELRAQVGVLESLASRLKTRSWATMSEDEREEVERELELVGLGRGKGEAARKRREAIKEQDDTSWGEVLFGKKGKGFEQEKDDTDWEKVFREADTAEVKRQLSPAPPPASVPIPVPVPTPAAAASPPAPKPRPAAPAPSSSSSTSTGIYL